MLEELEKLSKTKGPAYLVSDEGENESLIPMTSGVINLYSLSITKAQNKQVV